MRTSAIGSLLLVLWMALPAAAQETFVKIGLAERASRTTFGASGPARLIDARGTVVAEVRPMQSWQLDCTNLRPRLMTPAGGVTNATLPLRLVPLSMETLVFLAGKWYRGEGEFRPNQGRMVVINRLSLEDYLCGVVPNEMPASWPLESLKAQAIAARTYSIANLGQHSRLGFDMYPTIENQVYGGAGSERSTSNQAVSATHGEVLTYNGRVIRAYYHSSAGGYTEACEAVWGRSIPYLQAVPDYDQASPRYTWQKTYSTSEMTRRFQSHGYRVGEVRQLIPMSRGYSGRVSRLQVVGTNGSQVITGEQFRKVSGLYSTLFNVFDQVGGFLFAGRGFGHGLGLSQWGAKSLGERGYAYSQILEHYYPSAILNRLGG